MFVTRSGESLAEKESMQLQCHSACITGTLTLTLLMTVSVFMYLHESNKHSYPVTDNEKGVPCYIHQRFKPEFDKII